MFLEHVQSSLRGIDIGPDDQRLQPTGLIKPLNEAQDVTRSYCYDLTSGYVNPWIIGNSSTQLIIANHAMVFIL